MNEIRPPTIHVILIDGTFASLVEGQRSSIGRIYRLLRGEASAMAGRRIRLHYGLGQQWKRWNTLPELAMGRALEAQIIDAYGWLASGYREGDQIYFFGYSRGAFAVRSLAGMIGRIGLVRPVSATERNVRLAWRYYREGGSDQAINAFRRKRCLPHVPIRLIGCFDTVQSLGIPLPVLGRLMESRFRFHDAALGSEVEHGLHALALDETRAAFAPPLWNDDPDNPGRIEQMWFRGAHPDIGGQLSGMEFARPLSNIPLVWMLGRAEDCGLPLPPGWRDRFPCDATAPPIGTWRSWGKAFWVRAPRLAGVHQNERLHPTVPQDYTGPAKLIGQLAKPVADRAAGQASG